VDPSILLAVVQLGSKDVFPVPVRPRVDGACGDDADEDWIEVYFEMGGLEAGFYDVKGACDDFSAHSA